MEIYLHPALAAYIDGGLRAGHGISDRVNGMLARYRALVIENEERVLALFSTAEMKELSLAYNKAEYGNGPWIRDLAARRVSEVLSKAGALSDGDVLVLEELIGQRNRKETVLTSPTAEEIESARLAGGFTQQDACEWTGLSIRAWRNYEDGTRKMPPDLWDFVKGLFEQGTSERDDWRNRPRVREKKEKKA